MIATGAGTRALTLEGTITALNDALDGLTYTPGSDYFGEDTLSLEADDLGHTGSGGPQTAHASVAFKIIEVDQAPVNTVPIGTQEVAENTDLVFSAMGMDAISVEDSDSDGGVERVTLEIPEAAGTLTPGPTGKLTSLKGSGTDSLTLEGTIAALNEALEGLTYAPATDFKGATTLKVATDDLEHTGIEGPKTTTSDVSIDVKAVVYDTAEPDGPYTTPEDTTLEVAAPGVLANDTDSDSPPLTLQVKEVKTQPAHGTVTLNSDGSFTYVPDHLYAGEDSFSYVDTDGNTESNEATVKIEVEPETFDTAYDDEHYKTHEGEILEVAAPGVLENDTDSEHLELKAELVKSTSHGTIALESNGSFTYDPEAGYSGDDTFEYRDNDGNSAVNEGHSNVATVTIDVEHINQAPTNQVPGQQAVAENDSLSFSSSNAISVHDVDADGGVEQVKVGVGHGSLTPGSTGSLEGESGSGTATLELEGTISALDEALEGLTYAPAHNYYGPDSLTVETNDRGNTGLGGSKTTISEVSIEVTPVVYDTAVDDKYTTAEDETLKVAAPGVLENDTDSDSPALPLEAKVKTEPAHGTLTLSPEGSFTYVPDHLYVGEDSFTYIDEDGNTESNEATVTIEVEPETFDHAEGDHYKTHEGETLKVAAPGVLGNDTDSGGLELKAELVKSTSHGKLSLASDGSFTYEPEAGYSGDDTFEYRDNDGNSAVYEGHSNVATVTIDVEHIDRAPTNSVPGEQHVAENSNLTFSDAGTNAISVEDVDADGGVEKVSLGIGHGSLTPGATGSLTHVSGSGTAALTLEGTIAALNEALEGLTYAPAHNYHGSDSLKVETDDLEHTGLGGPKTTTSEVPVEVTPVVYDHAVGDEYKTAENKTLEIAAPGVLANDTDSDSPPLALEAKEVTSEPTHGTVTLSPDGSLEYVPDHLYTGDDSFKYVDTDGNTTSNEATVTIDVEPAVFDTAYNDSYSTIEDQKLEVDASEGVLANDTDSAGLTLKAEQVTEPAHGTLKLNPNGSFSYEPTSGFLGTDTFTYRDNDGNSAANEGHSNVATVTITVLSPHVNEPPTLSLPGTQHVEEYEPPSPTALDFSASRSDAITVGDPDSEGGVEKVTLVAKHGVLKFSAAGLTSSSGSGTDDVVLEGTIAELNTALETLSYEPAEDYSGSDTLAVEINDLGNSGSGGAKTASGSVTIEVRHPAPVAQNPTYNGAIGNTELSVGVAKGATPDVERSGSVLPSPAEEADGSTLTVVKEKITTTQGGTVEMNENGTFTYVPPVGYENGSDTFHYTEKDSRGGEATGTVTIKVDDARVWYVNDNDGTNGDGESNSPFNTLSSVSGSGSKTGSGDVIFLYGGGSSYGGGVELKASQTLDGQDEGLTVEGDALVTASGSNPTVTNGAGVGIKLAEGDAIRGVTVSGTSGAGIAAGKVGGFTLDSKVKIESTTGDGLEVSEGSGTITDEATIKTSSAHSLAISNRTGGTASISGSIEDSGTGILLSSNTGATIAFSGKLTLSTGAHEAFHASGGGTVTATNAESTAASTTATALEVSGDTIGAAGLKFKSISAGTLATGPSHGIVLEKTGPTNGLDVTGSGGAGSGGTVEHTTGTLGGVYLDETVDDSLTDMDVVHSSSSGIYGTQVYNLSVTGSSLANNGDDGLFVEATGATEVSVKATGEDSFTENKEQGLETVDKSVGTMHVTVEHDSFVSQPATGVDITGESGGAIDFDVVGNKLTDQQGNAINLFIDGTGKAEGEVVENEVGVAKAANSGSAAGNGIEIDAGKSETITTNVSKNKVFEIEEEHGIEAHAGEGSATLNITLEKNDVNTEETSSLDGIFVDSGVLTSDTSTVCMNATENTSHSTGTEEGNLTRETYGFVLVQQTPSAVFAIQGFKGNGTSNAEVDNYLASHNTLSADGGPAEVEFYKGFTSSEKCPTMAP